MGKNCVNSKYLPKYSIISYQIRYCSISARCKLATKKKPRKMFKSIENNHFAPV